MDIYIYKLKYVRVIYYHEYYHTIEYKYINTHNVLYCLINYENILNIYTVFHINIFVLPI